MTLGRLLLAALALLAVVAAAHGAPPAPDATAYVLVNPDTGETLAARSPDRRLPMASTTKMMTALLAIERTDLEREVVVPPEAVAIEGTSAELEVGERVRMHDLLAGLLVASGNDAAITIADAVAGSQERFVALMNARARRLGLSDTRFANPHGLDAALHYSSARDLTRLGRAAMEEPAFAELVGRMRVSVPGPNGVGTRTYESRNDLLDLLPEADGIKTGQTDGAGYALVAHARRPETGVQLDLAMIGSPSEEARARDAVRLLGWGLDQYARADLITAGAVLGRARVANRGGMTLDLRVRYPLRGLLRLGGPRVTERITAPAEVPAPLAAGAVLGAVELRQGERLLGRRDVVAGRDVDAPTLLDRVRSALEALLP